MQLCVYIGEGRGFDERSGSEKCVPFEKRGKGNENSFDRGNVI